MGEFFRVSSETLKSNKNKQWSEKKKEEKQKIQQFTNCGLKVGETCQNKKKKKKYEAMALEGAYLFWKFFCQFPAEV